MSDLQSIAATEVPSGTAVKGTGGEKSRSLTQDALRDLRHNWIFWFASAIALVVLLMAIAPSLFTPNDPADCSLAVSTRPAAAGRCSATTSRAVTSTRVRCMVRVPRSGSACSPPRWRRRSG